MKILLEYLRADEELAGLENKPWQHAFLMALARAPIPIVAAKFAGVTRPQVFAERAANEDFARDWDDAMEEGVDSLEAAAFLCAVFGDERPVFHGGEVKGTTVEHTAAIRTFMLKSLRPMTFNEPPAPEARERTIHTYDDFEKRLEMARA